MAVSLLDILVSANPQASPLRGVGKLAAGVVLLGAVAIAASLEWRRRRFALSSV